MRFAGSQNILGWRGCIRIIQSNSWCRTQPSMKYLNLQQVLFPSRQVGLISVGLAQQQQICSTLDLRLGSRSFLPTRARSWIWKKEPCSKHQLPLATRRALFLARLCGQLWAGPPHPPCLHPSSRNVSKLSKRQNMHEWAAAVLWSQTNLSGGQGRNSGSPPFPSSLSLCMEMDLPLVIC